MKKWLFTFLITILALPVFGTAVFAEDTVVYEDGTYENIPFVVKYGEDVYDQFSETATITIEDGKQYIQFTHTGLNFILDVTIPDGEVDILNDEENDTREVGFGYQGDLSEPVPFTIHMFYGMAHDMHAYLDISNIPVVDSEEEIEEPEEEPENPEEDTEDIALDDGFYNLNVNYLRADNDESSSMARYLDGTAFLAVANGRAELTITINDDSTVVLLQVEGKDAVESVVDGNKRYETFKIDNLRSLIDGYVEYQADMGGSIYEGNAAFRIYLDEGSIAATDASEKPGAGIEEEVPEEEEETEAPEEEEEVPEEDDELEEDNGKEDKEDNNKEEVNGDKVSTIDFVFKHATEDKASAADSFFAKPAVIIERDGEKYVQITATSPEYIDSLVAVFGKNRVAFKLVDGKTDVYEFKLPKGYDLSKEILVEMVISVPGFYEGQHYDTRLVFDMDTLTEIEAGEDIPEPTPNPNPNPSPDPSPDPAPKPSPGPDTPEKPELGDEEDNGDVSPVADNNGPSGNALNPQTGENTNLLLYVLLLIGSAIPLAVQVRRRFI